MRCRDLERMLQSTGPLPAAAREHLANCAGCRSLASVLAGGTGTPELPAALLKELESRMVRDLRPVRPLWPMGAFAACFGVVFAALVAVGGWKLGPFALAAMSRPMAALVLGAIGLSAVVLIGSLVTHMVPGRRHWINPGWLPVLVIATLAGLFTATLPHGDLSGFWRGWVCLRCGLEFFAVAAVVLWLFVRRGAFMSPGIAGATLGMLAGLTGAGVLEVHCPVLIVSHVLVWHLGAPLIGAMLCLTIGWIAERTRSPQRSSSS